MVHWMRNRQPRFKGGYQGEMERPSASYIVDMVPPLARISEPADTIPARHLHTSLNKNKHPVNVVRWTPDGRRLLTGSSSGEFTLWNGTGFNFETIMQAHDVAIRALSYSHNNDWLLSADHDGMIKYWQPNFNNVKVIQGHSDAIRDIAFSPNDSKFITAADDSKLKIFDFALGTEESILEGHGWDVKSVDWHPTKGLIVSGSKDHLVKLWDPRTSRVLTTLHGHKNTLTKTLFERVRGDCLATSARDQIARVFDLRMMRDIVLLKGHEKEISSLTWHPIHSNMISTGGGDGAIFHYLLDEPNNPSGAVPTLAPWDSTSPSTAVAQTIHPAHKIKHAHEFPIWSMDWHPLGHILASGSNDRTTKFWTRARPGDTDIANDRHHIGEAAAEAQGTWDRRGGRRQRQEEEEQELEDETEGLVDQKMPAKLPGFPGIPGLPLPGGAQPIIPGMGNAPPPSISQYQPPPPQMPYGTGVPPPPPGMDLNNPPDFAALAEMMQKAGLPPPLPGQVPPPPPGMIIPGMPPPPGFGLPPGFPPPPGMGQQPPFPIPGMGGEDRQGSEQAGAAGSVRRRGPLPSQEESLQMEQRRGKYTRAR
ncbi:pre-mRNA cleavage and polyadenylation factor (CPF) complex subunit [Cadophora gregata]|uniref:pre-mRNA cleavage and polyadenylation factor (CPF) complex subunit n=2 Tax=Cadophora gregata TaxID=51156 RepID=UPI0026DA7577|nr:pre-mRNA cleavage and polyadenylation factor (CPF) complex subunit [Cadophora gregata]KAK0121958.1 pre-mRNA cleavage and polyadenylation factor (CPF) complex subunit [Cadophora gregata]